MITLELRKQIHNLVETFSKPQLVLVYEFAQFLAQREEALWMDVQMRSSAYQEWVGSDNDIYDEVFADAVSTG
jgi:hypothetical protein